MVEQKAWVSESSVRGEIPRNGLPGLLSAVLTTLLVAVAAALLVPAASHAATSYQHEGAFGGACGVSGQPVCPADGLFRNNPAPQRIAVHQESGKLFVADTGNNQVQVFEPTSNGATFAFAIATLSPQGVALDPVSGDLYVVNRAVTPNPGRVTKFNPNSTESPTAYTQDLSFVTPVQGAGEGQVGAFSTGSPDVSNRGGIAVDQITRDILIVDTSKNQVHRYTSAGDYVSSFDGSSVSPHRPAFNSLMDVAAAPNGDVIVSDFTFQSGATPPWVPRIDRYNAAGQVQATLSSRGNNAITMGMNASALAVGADPGSGEVFAVSQIGDGFLNPAAPGRIYQFENDELIRDFAIVGTGLNGYKPGVALRSDPGRLYILSTDNVGAFSPPGIPRVQVFNALVPPTVSIDVIDSDSVTARGARISGTINPNGQQTSWHVQYRRVEAAGWPGETASMPIGDGNVAVEVETELEGLDPFTDYQARIAATTTGGIEVFSSPVSFKSLRDRPEISLVTASFLDAQSAEVRAEINPLSAPTRYWVEYGASDSYGSRAPMEPESSDAGSAHTAAIKVQKLAGLEPGTTYHYKVIAENDANMRAESDDRTFTTLAERGGLRDARGYELVTRQPMGIAFIPKLSASADHGDSVVYGIAEADTHLPGDEKPYRWIMGERGDVAWTFRPIDLPDPGQVTFGNALYIPEDMSRVFTTTRLSYHPDDQNGRRDLHLNIPGQDPVWITRSEMIPAGEPHTDPALTGYLNGIAAPEAGAIAEGGTAIAFGSSRPLTANDPNPAHYTQSFTGEGARLYKWKGGALTLISVRPDGSTPAGPNVKLGGTLVQAGGTVAPNSPHAMSMDGDRVFWSDGTSIFVHIDGEERSRLIGAGRYVDALADGSRVFYTSGQRMYSYDVDRDLTRDLTGAAQLAGPVAVAATGERVYFVGREALDADVSPRGLRPVAGSPNLYVTGMDGNGDPVSTRLVAVLGEGSDEVVWAAQQVARGAGVSPDGRVLTFASHTRLTGQPTGGGAVMQAFVYDDEARSLVCVSCPADGSVPQPRSVNHDITEGGQDAPGDFSAFGWQNTKTAKRLVSSDGTVFFDTATPLVAADENLERDVYEYRNGQLRMLTSGKPEDGASVIASASVDGSTVFIASSGDYDPRDIESGMRKLWAFRVGGGFAYNGSAPGCAGQGCEGAVDSTPQLPPLGSKALRGKGNLGEDEAERLAMRLLSVRRVRATGASGAILRVAVPGRGRITLRGPAVRPVSRSVAERGTIRLQVRPSRKASRVLARRGALRVSVKIRFKPRAGKAHAKRLHVRFKQRSARRGGRS